MRNGDPYTAIAALAVGSAMASFVHFFPGVGGLARQLPGAIPFLIMAAAAMLALTSFRLLRRARLIEDTPLSRTRSAAQGYVELEGHARLLPGPDIISPLSNQRCAWWSYTVWQWVKNGSEGRWEKIEEETSDDLFLLSDTTGSVIIDPYNATVHPSVDRSWRGRHRRPDMVPRKSEWFGWGEFRYREKLIQLGDMLYAAGEYRTQRAVTEFNESRDVTELLRDWKKNRRQLLARFDTNRNGQIEPEEWEAARQAAIREVREHQVQQATNPDINLLTQPSDRRSYILSTLSQGRVAQRLRWWAALWLLLALALAAALDYVLRQHWP